MMRERSFCCTGTSSSAARCGSGAAALFFRGQGDGEGLPYLEAYLLSLDGHGDGHALMAMPAPVRAHWAAYRNVRVWTEQEARD
jgi:hypothetical protein